MGWKFKLENANIVTYLTSFVQETPRIKVSQIQEFLRGIIEAAEREDEETFISSYSHRWTEQIAYQARIAQFELDSVLNNSLREKNFQNKLELYSDKLLDENKIINEEISINTLLRELLEREQEYLQPYELERVLLQLKYIFGFFSFYGLAVGKSDELKSFARHMALESRSAALILIPDDMNDIQEVNFLDPFPALALLGEEEANFPGILFWTRSGATTFASLKEGKANSLFKSLMQVRNERGRDYSPEFYARRYWNFPYRFSEKDAIASDILNTSFSKPTSKKILHLSDVHFGLSTTSKYKRLLKAQIEDIKHEINQIVITGDLIDTPKEEQMDDFIAFIDELEQCVKTEVIAIPGNHDRRRWGTLGTKLQQLINLRWRDIVPVDNLECVFFCFDSAASGYFARGWITEKQRLNVKTKFVNKCQLDPKLRTYSRIALIHHHLFPLNLKTGNFSQQVIKTIKSSISQKFVKMVEAKEFLSWCAGNEIPLVLHGHEHLQWTDSEDIQTDAGTYNVKTVACGTSLGVGKSPLTYNILTWNDVSQSWKEAPFEEKGDGSGFKQLNVRINVR